MSISETITKQLLVAEIAILVGSLNEASSRDALVPMPSKEEIEKMTVTELESLKRELRDLARSLGGVKGR